VVWLQAKMDIAESDKAAHEKTGSDKQSERHRNFQDNDSVAQAAMSSTATRTFAAVTERIIEVAANHLYRRRQSENDGSENGDTQSEGQNR